jgi:hypothetical protein
MEKIKLFWNKFVAILQKKSFVYSYPLVVLTVILICTRSFLLLLAVIVWTITMLVNSKDEK